MKDILLFSLGAIISTAFGVAITHLAVGWVGKDIVLWGCIVLIFFGIVIGIGHTVIEGIVVAAILGAGAYFFLEKIPVFLLYVPGALAGFSIFMIVIGLIAESKEVPQVRKDGRSGELPITHLDLSIRADNGGKCSQVFEILCNLYAFEQLFECSQYILLKLIFV
jgi:hypothetical protein